MKERLSKWAANAVWVATVALALAAAFAYLYLQAFVGFTPYDDEGALMQFQQIFLDGESLYEDTTNWYGPTTFILHRAAYASLGREIVTHDLNRFISVAMGIGTLLLLGAATFAYLRRSALALNTG